MKTLEATPDDRPAARLTRAFDSWIPPATQAVFFVSVGSFLLVVMAAAVANAAAWAAAADVEVAVTLGSAAGQDDVNPRADGEWQVNHLRKILKSLS